MTDILLVGGGLVGSTLALALADLGLAVTMIEREPLQDKNTAAFDDRGIALAKSSKDILQTMGLWSEIASTACAVKKIHVSEKGSFAKTVLDLAEHNKLDAFGYAVSGIVLGRILQAKLKQNPNIKRLVPASLVAIKANTAIINMDNTKLQIDFKLAIGADGADSSLRKLMNIEVEHKDYGHDAITCQLEFSQPQANTAYERFTANGPLALLPLINNKYALIWTMAKDKAGQIEKLSPDKFKQKLYEEFGLRLGQVEKVGAIVSYPLRLLKATKLAKDNMVLLGNAAQSLHPVAGGGLNLGLRDVAALHQMLKKSKNDFTDINHWLKAYSSSRKADRNNVILLSDGLIDIFASNFMPVKVLRRTGLIALSTLPFARRSFANFAMGKTGKASLLQRGLGFVNTN